MRILSAAMYGLLNSDTINGLSMFWQLTRKDGTILGFTDHDEPVQAFGVLFQAESGFSRTAIESRVDLSVPNFESSAILTSSHITESDLRAGKYDGSTIKVWMGIASDPEFATYGVIPIPGAFIGEIRLQDGVWLAEMHGLAYALSQGFIEVATPTCQADLFDKRCASGGSLNAADYTDSSKVTSVVIDRLQVTIDQDGLRFMEGTFDPAATDPVPPYQYGILTWTTGRNAGISTEVKQAFFDGAGNFNIQVYLQTPFPIIANDKFTITTGCDKTNTTCFGCYNNIANMRGFPGIPGLNFLFDYGEATS